MITVTEAARAGQAPSSDSSPMGEVRAIGLPKGGVQHLIEEKDLDALLDSGSLPRPAWLRRTSTGELMADVIAFLRRQRSSHRS